jgi:ribosome maturation factor RimP
VNRSVVSSESKYLRVSIQARTGTGLTTCAATSNVITSVLVELRPIRLNSVNQLGIPID